MKTWTTPGLDFLARNLVFPGSLHYAFLFILNRHLNLAIPRWALITASILLIPTRLAIETWLTYRKNYKRAEALGARLPPVVDSHSFGNWKLLARLETAMTVGYPGDEFWDFVDRHGKVFNLRLMFANVVCTIDPNNIKRVLATDFGNFVKGERFGYAAQSVVGTGIFNSDGERWKFHRSLARPFFSRDRVTDLERFDRHIQAAISLIKQRMKKGYAIDFQDLVQRITLDTSSEFLFGNSANSLNITVDELPQPYGHPKYQESLDNFRSHPANAFSEAAAEALWLTSQRDRVGWIWPLLEIFGDRTKKHMDVVNGFIGPTVKEAIRKEVEFAAGCAEENLKNRKETVGDDESLLEHLVKNTTDFTILRDQALNALIAGRDTVSSTTTFLFSLISQHPKVLQRLRAEVLEKVGPAARPTYEDVKEMKYLRAVINETLRVLPVIPWNVRECVDGALWPSENPDEKPIYIPPGSEVLYSVLMMHTCEDYWGPDAAEFDPDRWFDERKKYMAANPFIFLPFNAGPRICLGHQLAYNQCSIIIVRLLQAFSNFELVPDAVDPKNRVPEDWKNGRGRKAKEVFRPRVVMDMSSEGGMWLKATPVDDAE